MKTILPSEKEIEEALMDASRSAEIWFGHYTILAVAYRTEKSRRNQAEKERDEARRKLAEVEKFIHVAGISDTTPWSKEELVRAARFLSDRAIEFGVSLEYYLSSVRSIRHQLLKRDEDVVALREALRWLWGAVKSQAFQLPRRKLIEAALDAGTPSDTKK